ncbi:50S ribosomal protein L3 [Candidatus Woesearchaeota archaeon]|nr:50S ribosomal protein L3 [Candidatus Woesearchaeota archaeon]
MPNIRFPRSGSMQFWPRKRSRKQTATVKSWASLTEAKPLGFAGYKVGMTHCIYPQNNQNSVTKGMDISCPVTIIECPPLKTASIRLYKNINNTKKAYTEVIAPKLDKELKRKIPAAKDIKKKIDDIKPEDFDDLILIVYTQPKLTGIGKKKPEIFEIAVGGKKEEKLAYAKEKLGKEIKVDEVFQAGQQADIHAVTKGKGYQGPVKRFGIGLRRHKSEKTKRGPGSLGGWSGQGHVMYRVPHAGQMGYHKRTEYNKWLLKIGDNPEDINTASGYTRYGNLKNTYVLVRGSVAGPAKRLIRFNHAIRPSKKIISAAPAISYICIKKAKEAVKKQIKEKPKPAEKRVAGAKENKKEKEAPENPKEQEKEKAESQPKSR